MKKKNSNSKKKGNSKKGGKSKKKAKAFSAETKKAKSIVRKDLEQLNQAYLLFNHHLDTLQRTVFMPVTKGVVMKMIFEKDEIIFDSIGLNTNKVYCLKDANRQNKTEYHLNPVNSKVKFSVKETDKFTRITTKGVEFDIQLESKNNLKREFVLNQLLVLFRSVWTQTAE